MYKQREKMNALFLSAETDAWMVVVACCLLRKSHWHGSCDLLPLGFCPGAILKPMESCDWRW